VGTYGGLFFMPNIRIHQIPYIAFFGYTFGHEFSKYGANNFEFGTVELSVCSIMSNFSVTLQMHFTEHFKIAT